MKKERAKILGILILGIILLSLLSVGVYAVDYDGDGVDDIGPDPSPYSISSPSSTPTSSSKYPIAVINKIDSSVCKKLKDTSDWLYNKCNLWVNGVDISKTEPTELDGITEMIKWFLLVIIIFLIYSALSYANFPETAWVRVVIAIPTAFLATFFITTGELLSAMQSYTALGLTLTVFFPFLILGFFTMVVVSKANPVGIFLQRIMWIIFSVFLFLRTYVLWDLKTELANGKLAAVGQYESSLIFIKTLVTDNLIQNIQRYDSAMLFTLIIASLAALFIMASNKMVTEWLAKTKLDGEIQARKLTMQRADARDKLNAESMQGGN